MIRIRQVEVPYNDKNIKKYIAKKLKIKETDILEYTIHKQSIDARKKPDIYFIYEVDIKINNELSLLKHKSNDILLTPKEDYIFNITGTKKMINRPVIIGSGPAGLFSAYLLAKNGYKPIIFERGEKVEERINTVENFWKNNVLNTESNVQFGEGGAGTFSDGKLNTGVSDKLNRTKLVLETFVECGAPKEILYLNKPHIGTDYLRKVVINMRNKIISMGGEINYNSCLTDLIIKNDTIVGIKINDKIINTDNLILAIGHSARDTFKLLKNKNILMRNKPFAIGIRIQHQQKMINLSQYGIEYNETLGAASYKLTYNESNKGVYSFCMCPGGYVVNSSSIDKHLVINGMSNHDRNTNNANSAIVVTINEEDYDNKLLGGMEYQQLLEEKAYKICNGKIPVQLYKDYKNNIKSTSFNTVEPIFKGDYEFANINELFPDKINKLLVNAIEYYGNKIKGFNDDDAIIAAVESRTSSPIQIIRDNEFQTNIKGIYPIGEGAGYAGGITSAAIDGIKCAEIIASIYKN